MTVSQWGRHVAGGLGVEQSACGVIIDQPGKIAALECERDRLFAQEQAACGSARDLELMTQSQQ